MQTFFMFLTGGTVVGEHHLEGYFWGFSANSLVLLKLVSILDHQFS